MSEIAIRVRNVFKEYDVYSRPLDVAIEVLTRRRRHTRFRALNDISFEVAKGEVLGIIGPNGAGKSTLLKIITGVLEATSGTVEINGKVTAILELGLGFNPEYTGRENIYLSGLLYGMDREEVDRKIDSIIAFSGLGDFIERPVKTYSSGMHARLAFSIATAVDPDILIIDEALAAGDSAFVQKCLKRIRELCSGGRTVLLVSHGTGLLAQLCNRVLWIDSGSKRLEGEAISVVQAYDLAAHQAADEQGWLETVDDALDKTMQDAEATPALLSAGESFPAMVQEGKDLAKQVFRRGPVFIDSVEMIGPDGEATNRLTLLKRFSVRLHYRVEGELSGQSLGVAMAFNNKLDLSPVAQFMTQNIRPTESRETYARADDRVMPRPKGTLEIEFDYAPFRKGEYLLSIGILPNEPACWQFYEYRHFYYTFTVDDAGLDVGAPVFLNGRLEHLPDAPKVTRQPAEAAEATVIAPTPGHEKTLRNEIEAICFGDGGYPSKWPRHTACPACGTGILSESFRKYGFNHSLCGTCSFVCVNPYPPAPVIKKLYDGEYYTQIRELFELPLLRQGGKATPFSAPRDVLTEVISLATRGQDRGSWLDIGGGIGAFAKLIQETRPDWHVVLNELNQRSLEISRSEFGIDSLDLDVKEFRGEGLSFDVISSVAVLEHIPDPVAFVRSYMELLKPGGCFVNIVPHFTRLNAAVSHGSSPNVVPPYHLSLFNERAMQNMLSRVADVDRIEIIQRGPPAFQLLHHADYGDHWDISMPTPESPTPQSLQIKPYDPELANAISVLAEADTKMGDFFGSRDGLTYLVAICWKK